MSILALEFHATLRQIQIVEETLRGLPDPEEMTRSQALQGMALRHFREELQATLDSLEDAYGKELAGEPRGLAVFVGRASVPASGAAPQGSTA